MDDWLDITTRKDDEEGYRRYLNNRTGEKKRVKEPEVWSKTPPTEPGLYWAITGADADGEPSVIELFYAWKDMPLQVSMIGEEVGPELADIAWWGPRIERPLTPVPEIG